MGEIEHKKARAGSSARSQGLWHSRGLLTLILAAGVAFGFGRLSMTSEPAAVFFDSSAVTDARELRRSLDELEAQLTLGETWVQHNEELARRHRSVTAIACAGAEQHASDMLRIAKRNEGRRWSAVSARATPLAEHAALLEKKAPVQVLERRLPEASESSPQ